MSAPVVIQVEAINGKLKIKTQEPYVIITAYAIRPVFDSIIFKWLLIIRQSHVFVYVRFQVLTAAGMKVTGF
jgi:hypothetical protein